MEGRKNEYKKGLWTKDEDKILREYVRQHGKGKWNRVAKATGLKRSGKSCRLRWINYLNPELKHGNFSEDENDLIIRLHNLIGNRWSLIAGRVPGRTDNQVKNHWNTHLSKKFGMKNNGKNKIISCSTTEIAQKRESNSNCNNGIVTQQIAKDDTKSSIGISTEQDLRMTDVYDKINNFLFSNNDLSICNPNFFDFIDDFGWNCL